MDPPEIPQPSATGGAGVGVVLLVAFAALASFWGLDAGPPLGDHEAIVGESAREARELGHWLIPHFSGEPFIRKPPLQVWLAALASYVVDPPEQSPPVSELAARFPSALAGFAAVIVVYLLARSMFAERTALIAGAIMACSVGTLFYSHNAQTEMLVSGLTAASLACFYVGVHREAGRTRYLAAFYVLLGLAMLAKAPLPLALVGATLFVYWFVTLPLSQTLQDPSRSSGLMSAYGAKLAGQFRGLRKLWLIPGIVIFLLLFLPWPVYVYFNVENALKHWNTEFIDRYSGEMSERAKPFWYYLPLLFAFTVPFCLSLPEAFAAPFRRAFHGERRGLLFAFTWVVVQVAFLSTSAFKRPHYMLPVLPALCLLLAPVIDHLFFRASGFNPRRILAAVIAICVGVTVGLVFGAIEVVKDMPSLLWAIIPAGLLLLAGVAVAGHLFRTERRPASLLTLIVMPLILFAWIWSSLGRSEFEKNEVRLAHALQKLSLGPDARITWTFGPLDARVPYYLGAPIHYLYTPLEMENLRKGRGTVSNELLLEGADRIADGLESDREEYFIMHGGLLKRFHAGLPDVRFKRIITTDEDSRRALVVITNPWNTIQERNPADAHPPAASHPAAQPTSARATQPAGG